VELGVRPLEVGDVQQDVATPDEVGGPIFDRQRLRATENEADVPRRLDVGRARVDPDDGEAQALGEAVGVPAVAAPDVEDERTLGQLHAFDQLVEQLGAPRLQALLERGLECCLDPRETRRTPAKDRLDRR
jgi:hypothetical protein